MAGKAPRDDTMRFCVHLAAWGYVHRQDRFVELTAAAGVLRGARSSWERVPPTETRTLTLRFSRELLPLRPVEIAAGCAPSTDSADPAIQMLADHLGRLFEVADDLTAPQRLDAGRAAIDLLATVLRDVTPSVPSEDGADDVLLEMMRMHAREHLADPHLRVEELARRHHVSVRHAYSLFARTGTTPGAYLREQRLLAAEAMLSDPRYARLEMSDIAAATGFRYLRTFERAFQRQYGMTPSSWRCEHCHPGSTAATLKQEMPPR
jgi:AraC-like DNA-binding protein